MDFAGALCVFALRCLTGLFEQRVDMGEDHADGPDMAAENRGWWGQVPPFDCPCDPVVIDPKELGEFLRVQHPFRRQRSQAGAKALQGRGGY